MKNIKKILGVLACAFLYSSMYLLPYIKYIFYDAVVEATGFTNTQIGFTLTVYIIASIICTIPSGWLADKFEPKKMLVISGFAHFVVSLLTQVFIRNYPMTLVCFFLMGITSLLGFWCPVFKAVSQVGTEEEQGRYYGLFEGFNGIGSMVFNFGALWVYGRITGGSVAALKAVYIFYAVSSLVATLMVAFLYKKDKNAIEGTSEKKERASTKEILSVLKVPKVWLFSLLVFGIYGFYCGSSYLTPYFSTVLGVSVVFSGSLATLKNYGTRLVGAPVAGMLCDKIGRLKFMIIAGALTIALMIVFMLMPANSSALIPIMIIMFALALVNVSMKGTMFSVIDEMGVDSKVAGMAIAIASLIGFNLPDVALHPIFGAVLDANEPVKAYKIIFGVLFAMLALAFVMAIILSATAKKKAEPAEVVPEEAPEA